MRHMQIRGRGHRWRQLSILCIGLIAILPAGPATVPPGASDRADHAGHGRLSDVIHRAEVRVAAAPESAPDLALRLQALLGQHSMLAADFMRGRIRGDDDFVQAANAALGKNTEAMTALVDNLFGPRAARSFRPLWGDHVVALFAYAGGVADRDDAVRAQARRDLTRFERDLGSFFAGASAGRLSTDAAQHAMLAHVDHLLTQADDYAADDYAKADSGYREAYRHTYDLGRSLAAALLAPADVAALQAPTWRLRSELGRLLAEHVVLMVDVTRAAITNTPDFDAAAELVNDNTRDLAGAVDSLFGASAAKDFQALWAYHVEQLVAYAGATAAQDADRRTAARAALRGFEQRMAAFLETATGKRLDSAGLSAALLAHDGMLLRHTDAFGAKDYRTAHEIAYQTYEHMFDLARRLAGAFGATVADRLPAGGPRTGQGGAADIVKRR